jgi:hypothetical protein
MLQQIIPGKKLLILGFLALASLPLQAQFIPGQYEDEAPFRTWNSFPYLGASSLGRGQTAFTLGADATVSPANPALLAALPKWTFSFGGSLQNATAMRYGPLNSGPISSDEPLGHTLFSGDHAAVSFHSGRWAFAAVVFLSEAFDRPVAEVVERYSNGDYVFRYTQAGFLRTYHLAAAFRISSRLAVGFGLNIDSGRLETELFEDILGRYQISGTKTAELSGLFINGGLFWDISPSVRAAVAFRTPSTLESRTETVDRFTFPVAGTDISINGSSDDSFKRPLVIGAGVSTQISTRLRVLADIAYLRWSAYRAVWLGEGQVRNFRDTIRLSAGGEYAVDFRLFGKNGKAPVRLGLVYDPQPTQDPRSAYLGFTLGTGLEIGGFRLNLGALISAESGSGDGLLGRRISLDLGYIF